MVGWTEEVLKGREGLRRDDLGRLLNARYGLSLGLSRMMVVHERLLLEGGNAMHAALAVALGESSSWVRLRDRVFGLTASEDARALCDQVRSGIELYRETATLVTGTLLEGQRRLVNAVQVLVDKELAS